MSGAQQPMPQQGGQPQLPPQVLQMLMQRMQQQRMQQGQQGGGMPPGQPQMPQQGPPRPGMPPGAPPQGMPPQGGQPPPGAPPQGGPPPMQSPPPQPQAQPQPPPTMQPPQPQGVPPNLAMFGRAAQAQPGQMGAQQGAKMGMNPQEAAQMGRMGDTVLAHLTPGEIIIPKNLQSPQLMQMLRQVFLQAGAQPAQFVVGAPQAQRNPHTGMQEYNGVLSSILPLALGVGAAIFAPEAASAMGLDGTVSAGAASSIGSGLGTAAGTALTGGTTTQALTSGLGATVGNSLAGGMGGSGTGSTAGGAADANNFPSPSTTPFGSADAATLAGQYAQGDGQSSMLAGAQPSGMNPPSENPGTIGGASSSGGMFGSLMGGGNSSGQNGQMTNAQLAMRGVGAAAGGALGGVLSATPKSTALPTPGPTPVYNPAGPNPNSGAAGRPNFTNYNPYASVLGQPYNFYPTTPPG